MFCRIRVLGPVSFKIARGFFPIEMLNVTMHQRRANTLPLPFGRDADRTEVHMRLIGIEMAPSAVPPDDLRIASPNGLSSVAAVLGTSSGAGRQ